MKRNFEGHFEKRGDEYFLVLPEGIENALPFKRGDKLKVALRDGRMIIEKAQPGEEYTARVL